MDARTSVERARHRRQYQRKYKTFRVRTPHSVLRDVTVTAESVTLRIFTRGEWIPVEFKHAAGMAADLAVLGDALGAWDDLAAERTVERILKSTGGTPDEAKPRL